MVTNEGPPVKCASVSGVGVIAVGASPSAAAPL